MSSSRTCCSLAQMGPFQGAECLFLSVPLLQVVPNTQLKHILSLWQVLAARRSMLLVQMNQVREMRLGMEIGFAPWGGESQNHRITESQNSRGWKGPLWVI